jgi:selenocysteine-specific translation elongation factor
MQKVSIEDSKIEQIEAMSTNDAILSSFQDKIKNKERNIEELKQRLTQLKASTNEERQHPV